VCTGAAAGAAVLVSLFFTASSAAATRYVAAGGDLQGALNVAQPGDVIVLEAGARFVGTFQVPIKAPGPAITIRSSSQLPERRVTEADAPLLPTILSGNTTPALTIQNTSGWRLDGIRFESTPTGENEILVLQDADDVVLDRLLIVAGAAGQKRAVRGNGTRITLRRSHIANIWRQGQDSQAFSAWDGAGPYTIVDNYLEAASENVMFGGADSRSEDRIPSDILVEANHFSKRLEWKGLPRNVKNLFELKAAKRVVVRNNLLERNWTDGQVGYAIVLTPRNQNGTAPWSVVEDVIIEQNVIRESRNGVNLSGHDDLRLSARTQRITIRHNLWQLEDTFLLAGGEAGEVTVDHNTVVGNRWRAILFVKGGIWENGARRTGLYSIEHLTFTNNLIQHGEYGVFGDACCTATAALIAYTRGYYWTHNVLAGGGNTYPAITWRPTLEEYLAQFTSDYTLLDGCMYRGAANDGMDVGVVWEAPPLPPPPPPPPADPFVVYTSSPLPIATVGLPYAVSLAANRPGQWSVTTGALPSGLTLAPNGLLSGVPTQGGTATFTVTVADMTTSTSKAYELRVRPRKPGHVRVMR
jgi:hypothetical protein